MKGAGTTLLGLGVVVLVALVLVARRPRDPIVVVHNGSAQTLERLRIHGAGFSETIPTLASGENVVLRVAPSRPCGRAVSFDVGGQRHDVAERGRIEPDAGSTAFVHVAADFSVSVETRAQD